MSSPTNKYDSASAIVGASATVRHLLHIDGYSHTKATCPVGEFIRSQPFRVGGHACTIWYYPNGVADSSQSDEYISIFLCLEESATVVVKASFSVLDQDGEPVPYSFIMAAPYELPVNDFPYGFYGFMEKKAFEESEWLKDDSFRIVCEVSVSMPSRAESRPPSCVLPVVPPSDLHRHLGDLRVARYGADVTILVEGETFHAHRCILASRSPVFKAQLFGAMMESTSTSTASVFIQVPDMVPQVFEALLHFVYTDSLPEMIGHDESVVAQHLLEAADRYDMPRLKLICEEKLCKQIEVTTAATTLVLAEQHRCHELKKACFQFLQCHHAFRAVLETDGFEHLAKTCPALVTELMSKHIGR